MLFGWWWIIRCSLHMARTINCHVEVGRLVSLSLHINFQIRLCCLFRSTKLLLASCKATSQTQFLASLHVISSRAEVLPWTSKHLLKHHYLCFSVELRDADSCSRIGFKSCGKTYICIILYKSIIT